MKQIIFGVVIALLLSGFFAEQAFAQINGTNGGKGQNGSKGGIGTSGNAINGRNGTSANGHGIGGTINSGN